MSFETTEGYLDGESPAGVEVSLLGGSAVVVAGDAAHGDQYLSYEPVLEENGLVLSLGPDVYGGLERSVGFSVRLNGDPETTRLVLSYGQTIGIRPVAGGVILEIAGNPPKFVSATGLVENAWVGIEIRESAADNNWSLWVANRLVASDLPLQARPASADVLIFADGSLDLDAIYVFAEDAGPGDDAAEDADSGSPTETTVPSGPASELAGKTQNELFGAAHKAAFDGKIAELVEIVALMVDSEPETAEWYFDMGQSLSVITYALHDEGRNRRAAVVANESLAYIDQARQNHKAADGNAKRATYDFVSGQLWEGVIGDLDEAKRLFEAAAAINSQHSGARDSLERVERKRNRSADAAAVDRSGGAL